MIYNILKSVHIFSVIAWMAGLLYLPRIFMYHADTNINKETSETFKVMERKLFSIIMTPAFIFTWITGLSMTHYLGFDTPDLLVQAAAHFLIVQVLGAFSLLFYFHETSDPFRT